MTKERRKDAEREALFISRANAANRFIQTVGMFALCVVMTIVAAVMDLPNLVALLVTVSTLPATLGFLWIVDRVKPAAASLARIPRALRSVPLMVAAVVVAVLAAIALSLQFGAGAGLVAHLLVYGAEFALAVAIRARRVLRESPE
ncbi:hypothetical protein ACQEVI_06070 [Promicromonospora sp. CA-289599]|uniref:hypothetical protein n=1 Tax=Promicromonospora sp. CA-289599 TaxID=3240014 RepID=UPI003D93012C